MHGSYILSCLFGILGCFVAGAVGRVAIVGGEIAKENEFRYQAVLLVDNNVECGGGIIGNEFILTAAHCLMSNEGVFYNDPIIVLAGVHDLQNSGKSTVVAHVHKVYVPKEFTANITISPGDIAVLKLKHPLNLAKHTHLKQLNLPENEHETYFGKTAEIAGFGWDWIKIENGHEDGGHSDGRLRFAKVDVLGLCHKDYFPLISADKQICAKVHQHKGHSIRRGVCVYDSGGPLVHQNTVIGILSVSPTGCSEKVTGGLYTRVSHYRDFIYNATRDVTHDMRTHILP